MKLATKRGWLLPLLLVVWNPSLADRGKALAPHQMLTKNGALQGQRIRLSGTERDVEVFLGIPYAKPPVGALRFSSPEPVESWTGLRDATSYPPMCLQDIVMGQLLSDAFSITGERVSGHATEDCLYLNIYVPSNAEKARKLPVMVWIHGGGLLMGSASAYDGSVLAAYENVVVVVIQYRLGILGFYSTGDEHARGNWGLLDQVAALHWIQENIADFGGDPSSVTIFGNSAGGFSTSAHVLSPLSKGLFHKAISESGVAVTELLLNPHPEKLAKKIAESVNCSTSSSAEMVRCLRGKMESEILLATLKMDFTRVHLGGEEKHIVFFPAVVDGIFFPKSPKELLAEKSFSNVPHIIGFNNHEFGWIISQLVQFPDFTKGLDKEMVNLLLRSLEQFTNVAPQHVHVVADEYFRDLQDLVQLRDQLLDLLSDVTFVAPSILTARYHRDAGYPAYVYELQHIPSVHKSLRPDFVKVDHGDEIVFVFGKPFFTGEATEKEKQFSRTIMKYWSNFARNGNPNGKGLVEWPSYGLNEEYLQLDLEQKKSEKPRNSYVDFWLKALPEKMKELTEEQKSHLEL